MTLFDEINSALETIGHGWTSPAKAQTMAAAIIALRPAFSVEIGVYAGKGLISMAMAHRAIGHGIAIGVDPYQSAASAEGQLNPEDHKFWSELDHEMIFQLASNHIIKFGVQNTCRIERMRSNLFSPPDNIGVLRIDGNHGETVLSDIAKYAPKVSIGGFLFLDDLGWTGGAVVRAAARLKMMGWVELYRLDDGAVFQNVNRKVNNS